MQPGLLETLNDLVQSSIRDDPEATLLWVSKSQRRPCSATIKVRTPDNLDEKLVACLAL
jgi:hypothetical protein